jgi:CBS-domain-containing membrane protein
MVKNRSLQFARPTSSALSIPGNDPWCVDVKDPATAVMTDFHERSAVTVSEHAPIDKALEHMKHAGVRAAFAVDEKQQKVVGMISAYDIQGEKPLRHLEIVGCTQLSCSRDDVLVRDIMEKVEDWQVVSMADVEHATVGLVLDAFNSSGRSHIAVVETSEEYGQRLRGLFSSARIKRLVER